MLLIYINIILFIFICNYNIIYASESIDIPKNDIPVKIVRRNGPTPEDLQEQTGNIEDTDWKLMPKLPGGQFDKWQYAYKYKEEKCRLCPNVFYLQRYAPYMTKKDDLNLNDPFDGKSAGASLKPRGHSFLEAAARVWAHEQDLQYLEENEQYNTASGQLLVRTCCRIAKSEYKHNAHYEDLLNYWGGIPKRGKLGISGMEAFSKEDKKRAEERYNVDFLEEAEHMHATDRDKWLFGPYFRAVIHKVNRRKQMLLRKLRKTSSVPCCKLCPLDCPPKWRKKKKRPTVSASSLFGFRERFPRKKKKNHHLDNMTANDEQISITTDDNNNNNNNKNSNLTMNETLALMEIFSSIHHHDPNSAEPSHPSKSAMEPPRFQQHLQHHQNKKATPKMNVNVVGKQLPKQGTYFFRPNRLAKPSDVPHIFLPKPNYRQFNDHSYADRDFDPPGMQLNPPDRCETAQRGCCELCYDTWSQPVAYDRMKARWRRDLKQVWLRAAGLERYKKQGLGKKHQGDFGVVPKDIATAKRATQPVGAYPPLKMTFNKYAANQERAPANPHSHMVDHTIYEDNGKRSQIMWGDIYGAKSVGQRATRTPQE